MARKNFRADNSAIIHFDSRTNTVMAQSTTSHNHVKQKVTAVREVVPGRAFDEIVLVLQYYDYNSEKAIQAYLEDGAKEALQQWHFSGTKAQNKKKRPRKGRSEEGGGRTSPDPNSALPANSNNNNIDKPHMLNGDHTKDISDQARIPAANYRDQQQSYPEKSRPLSHPNNTSLDRRDKVQLIGSKSSEMNQRDKQQQRSNNNNSSQKNSGNNSSIASSQEVKHQRIRTISECSSSSLTSGPEHFTIKKAGLERSVKDLQRQQSSLERLRRTFEEEVDKGPKKIKSVFEEVRKALYDRELQMITEFEQMKLESRDLFIMRQQKASELKTKIDRADCMNENELTDLRADVKHFVSERRLDEDLANTTRFMYDTDNIIGEIKKFGLIIPVRHLYSTRRPSTSSVASSGPGHDDQRPHPNHHRHQHTNPSATSTQPTTITPAPVNGINGDGGNESDDTELTAQDLADLQQRLQNSLRINRGGPRNRPKSSDQSTDERKGNNNSRRKPRNDRSPRKPDDRPRENRPRSPRKSEERSGASKDQRKEDEPRINNGPRRDGSGRGRGRGGNRGRGRGRGRGGSPTKDASSPSSTQVAPATNGNSSAANSGAAANGSSAAN